MKTNKNMIRRMGELTDRMYKYNGVSVTVYKLTEVEANQSQKYFRILDDNQESIIIGDMAIREWDGDTRPLSSFNDEIYGFYTNIDFFDIMNHLISDMDFTRSKKNNSYKTYIFLDKSNSLYKIGKSCNVESRLRTFKISNVDIEKVLEINEDVEGVLHDCYEDKRVKGEWFDLSKEDIEHIRKMWSNRWGSYVK